VAFGSRGLLIAPTGNSRNLDELPGPGTHLHTTLPGWWASPDGATNPDRGHLALIPEATGRGPGGERRKGAQ